MEILFYMGVAALALGLIGYYIGKGLISFKSFFWYVLLGALALPFALNAAIWLYASSVGETVTPAVLGLQSERAISALEDADLKGEVIGVSFSSEPGGTVISQQPEGGKKVKKGRTVNLVVSASDSKIIVPNVMGKASQEAEQSIKSAGLSLGQVFERESGQPGGSVIEQDPSPGMALPRGSSVSITISSGGLRDD